MNRHRLLRWIALPLLLLVATGGLAIYAFAIHASAKSILKDVSALRVGVSSIAEVEALATRHQGALRERHCDNQKCIVSFEVYNTWLYRLKLEPIARFRATVEVDGGTVDYIEIDLSRDTRVFPTSSSAGITSEYGKIPKYLGNVSTRYWFPTPVGKPFLWVALTTEANAVERQHAYAYSLRCLIKPGGGCDLPCNYLPAAWHDWEAELGTGGFGIYYPNRQRCR